MKKNSPLVSVVIPVHNGEKFIEEAIRSCFDQTYDNIEIVVVDDKSTDGTLDLLKKLEKDYSNLIIIEAEKQDGLGNVINIGIRKSKGKYIARLDADDVMYPTRLELQVDFLESNPEVVVVGGQIDTMNEDGKIIGERRYSISDKNIKRNLFMFQPFAHPAVMMCRTAVEKVNLYPEGVWKVEDVMFFFKMSKIGKFHNLPDKVIKYRMTTGTQSQGDLVGHFKETEKARRWAIKELDLKPSMRERFWWFAEKVGVSILSVLPQRMYIWIFHLVRKVLR